MLECMFAIDILAYLKMTAGATFPLHLIIVSARACQINERYSESPEIFNEGFIVSVENKHHNLGRSFVLKLISAHLARYFKMVYCLLPIN